VWLGKITGWELVAGLLIELTWLLVMIGACRFVWWRGTKRYSGFGG
ncbi:MAG: ABC transporter permease, partial [Planctomycetaceae bacterium]|nr:ABC transporter permease [Planctomycetaceae bacterium]